MRLDAKLIFRCKFSVKYLKVKKIYKKLLIQLFKFPIHDSIKSAQWFENYDDPSSDKVLVTQSRHPFCTVKINEGSCRCKSKLRRDISRHRLMSVWTCISFLYGVILRLPLRDFQIGAPRCVSTLLDWVTLISNTNQFYDVCSNLNVKRYNCLRL